MEELFNLSDEDILDAFEVEDDEEIEEKMMNEIPYVKEVLVYGENDVINAEFFLDESEYPDARERIKADVNDFNRKMPFFKNVNKIKVFQLRI